MIHRIISLVVALHIGFAPVYAVSTVPRKIRKKLISFNFENEDLVTIANSIASELQINLVLPLPPHTITAKVTLHNQRKITLDEAFTKLYTLFDTAGYAMVPHGKDTYL